MLGGAFSHFFRWNGLREKRKAHHFVVKLKLNFLSGRPFVMAACLKNGEILLLRSFDDVIPQVSQNSKPWETSNVDFTFKVLQTGFQSYCVDWTNSGELLAVAGKSREFAIKSNHTIRYENVLHFYNDSGTLIYNISIPSKTVRRH